jgi:hypothetical protein
MSSPTALRVVTIDVERGPCPIPYPTRSMPRVQSRVPRSNNRGHGDRRWPEVEDTVTAILLAAPRHGGSLGGGGERETQQFVGEKISGRGGQ